MFQLHSRRLLILFGCLLVSCSTTRILPTIEMTVTPYKFSQATNYQDHLKTYQFLITNGEKPFLLPQRFLWSCKRSTNRLLVITKLALNIGRRF